MAIDKWTGDDYAAWRRHEYMKINKYVSTSFPIINRFIELGIFKKTGSYMHKGEKFDLYIRDKKRTMDVWKATPYYAITEEISLAIVEKKLF